MLTSRCPGSQRTRARARPESRAGVGSRVRRPQCVSEVGSRASSAPTSNADQAGWQPLAGSRSPACAGQRPSTRLGSAVAKTHGTDGARRGVSGTVRQRERRVTKRCTCAVFDGLGGSSRSSCTTANPTASRPSRRAWRGCPIAPAGSFNGEDRGFSSASTVAHRSSARHAYSARSPVTSNVTAIDPNASNKDRHDAHLSAVKIAGLHC
jgi:hypothetical protein